MSIGMAASIFTVNTMGGAVMSANRPEMSSRFRDIIANIAGRHTQAEVKRLRPKQLDESPARVYS